MGTPLSPSSADLLQRIEKGEGGVGFLGRGQIERSRSQVKAPFGHAHLLEGLGAGVDHLDGVGVGHAHILAGKDQHAAEDEARRLAGIDHLGHPVHRGVRVAAAQALDEGADRVEVIVALFVVEHGAALDRFFGDGERDVELRRLSDCVTGISGARFNLRSPVSNLRPAVVSTASSSAFKTARASPLATSTRWSSASSSRVTARSP
ncbi:MAG: hypothetical protein V9G19_10825 [Tetrasphaera sp.]